MSKLVWRAREHSRSTLVGLALLSMIALAIVERAPVERRGRYYEQKLAAARLAEEGFATIRAERLRRGHVPDPVADPTGSGLLGVLSSSVTSNNGSLRAKQTSVDPNFAALVVELLRRAGVREGDTIAVAFSGSFPAINVSVLAAAKTLGLTPLIISSNAASQWGANDPGFLWIDWERTLRDAKVFDARSIAATIGGVQDRGLGMSPAGIERIAAAIDASGVPRLAPKDYAESVELRLARYREAARGAKIAAYVNVGGGTSSVGTRAGKHLFRPGLNASAPIGPAVPDSIMSRFADEGVPVIHLVNLNQLARRHGLSVAPKERPRVGQGAVFSRLEYDARLAGGFLAVILAALYALLRSKVGARWLSRGASDAEPTI